MITLTTPPAIKTVIGGSDTVVYDKFVLSNIRVDPVTNNVNATLLMSSTSSPQMDVIQGSMNIIWATKKMVLESQRLDFYRSITLGVAQQGALQTIIQDTQNAFESGLISLSFVDGVQSPGV